VEDYTYKVKQRAYLSEQVPYRLEPALANAACGQTNAHGIVLACVGLLNLDA
jgi:hypothetical protein